MRKPKIPDAEYERRMGGRWRAASLLPPRDSVTCTRWVRLIVKLLQMTVSGTARQEPTLDLTIGK